MKFKQIHLTYSLCMFIYLFAVRMKSLLDMLYEYRTVAKWGPLSTFLCSFLGIFSCKKLDQKHKNVSLCMHSMWPAWAIWSTGSINKAILVCIFQVSIYINMVLF